MRRIAPSCTPCARRTYSCRSCPLHHRMEPSAPLVSFTGSVHSVLLQRATESQGMQILEFLIETGPFRFFRRGARWGSRVHYCRRCQEARGGVLCFDSRKTQGKKTPKYNMAVALLGFLLCDGSVVEIGGHSTWCSFPTRTRVTRHQVSRI